MDSRTLIRKVIRFDGAPRIGYNLPEPWPNDFAWGGIAAAPDFVERRWTEGREEFWTDEWGNTWHRLRGLSQGGEVARGALEEWDRLDAYRPPDLGLESRYEGARKAFAAAPDKYHLGGLPGCAFNISRYTRRIENYLADCLLEPARVRRLSGLVMDEVEKAVHRMADAGADGVFFCEDWGTQERLLMSPRTFRDLFLPEIERLCRAAAGLGLDVWMHSCGYIWEIIEDLIRAGIRVLQFDQPSLYGVERLDDAFGGRVAFECPVDIQRTLQTRDAAKIRDEARRLCRRLGGHGGGFVACRYGDEPGIGLEPQWQDAACEAFVAFGGG
jgi:hypothetical protein